MGTETLAGALAKRIEAEFRKMQNEITYLQEGLSKQGEINVKCSAEINRLNTLVDRYEHALGRVEKAADTWRAEAEVSGHVTTFLHGVITHARLPKEPLKKIASSRNSQEGT